MDLARISGMKVEELKNFLRLRGLRTYEEVDMSPQNSFQSPDCAVHRSGVLKIKLNGVVKMNDKYSALGLIESLAGWWCSPSTIGLYIQMLKCKPWAHTRGVAYIRKDI